MRTEWACAGDRWVAVNATKRWTIACLALAACGPPSSTAPSTTTRAGEASCEESASEAHTWAEPALDRLLALSVDPSASPRMFVEDASGPARVLFATDADVLLRDAVAPRLSRALDDALSAPLDRVPLDARITLQNDVWGLWQRLDAAPASAVRDGLRATSARLVLRLAPRAEELGDGAALPATARAATPESAGWRERGTEHSVLSHESLFGLRRLFRVLTRQGERDRALVSQLVTLDTDGRAHLTSIAGGMEILELSGPTPRATVLELSRRSLRCGPSALLAMDAVHGLPGLGTNRFLAALDPPQAPVPSVCARCHEDVEGRPDVLMSLPNDDLARMPRRHAELLDQATRAAAALLASAR